LKRRLQSSPVDFEVLFQERCSAESHITAVTGSKTSGIMSQYSDCRMYEQKYPEVDDVVMVQVKSIAEMGAYVSLLEYNGIEGMILLSELSRRRIRSITKLIKVGGRNGAPPVPACVGQAMCMFASWVACSLAG